MELHIKNISKTYPNGLRALKDVTLTIPSGVYGLLGPTGSGKSTLMRILRRLEQPDDGSIHLGSVDVLKQRADDALSIVDAATGGLDLAGRARLSDHVSDLGTNRIVILSTDAVQDVPDVCSRLAIINDGRILLEIDPPRAVGSLRDRIWEREISKEALPRVQREYAVVSAKLIGGRTLVRVYSYTAPAVGFERAKPDLEDVYLCALAGHLSADSRQLAANG